MDIKIIIATHIKYRMLDSDIYLPLQVGAAGKPDIGYVRDDTGENISSKNPYYCELTGLYWLWKNVDADYYGLMHYRRRFVKPGTFFRKWNTDSKLPDREYLEKLLRRADIILPRKRNYLIENIYSHYAHTHYKEHLDITKEIIADICPDYLTAYNQIMDGKTAHMFNMLIMGRDKLDAYCSWLFPILEELEKRVDSSGYDAFQSRYVGRVGEILLNVWIEKNGLRYEELPFVVLGKVRWVKKILSFLGAKFLGKRYSQGF